MTDRPITLADRLRDSVPSDQPILDLESRMMVALAGRGEQTICEFVLDAIASEVPEAVFLDFDMRSLSDSDLVLALEAAVEK